VSSRAIAWAFWGFAAAHVALWTGVALVTQPNAPLDTIEVVAWGHEWQLGHQNHPPLTAWLAEMARVAGGSHGNLALYLLTALAVATALWAVWRLARFFVGDAAALAAVVLAGIASRYTWMTLEFNHAAAVLPFFWLAVLCFYRALATPAPGWWLLAGLCLGLGALAKYTIALLALAMAGFLVADGEARRTLRTAGPYIGLGVALVVTAPHLVWLVRHGFPTVTYALWRARSDMGLLGHLVHPADFVVNQFFPVALTVLGAVAFVAWPFRLRPIREEERFKRRFLLVMVLGPGALAVLLSLITGATLRSMWGMPFWAGLALLLLFSFEPRNGPMALRWVACIWAAGTVLNVSMAFTEMAAPYVTGKGARIQFPGRLLAERVTETWRTRFDAPFVRVGGERWLVGNVSFYAPSRPSVLTNFSLASAVVDESACPWTSVDDFRRHGGVLLWFLDNEGEIPPLELREDFPGAQILPPLVLPWQTGARIAPVRVGIAIVTPGSVTASR